jgi:hypothetical protein
MARAVVLTLVMTGCGSAGTGTVAAPTAGARTLAVGGATVETYNPEKPYEEAVEARERDVWPHLRPVFEQLGVEVTEVKRTQWIMGNPRFSPARLDGDRLSTFLECGRDHAGPYADQHQVRLTLMVQLLRTPAGGTNVNVLLTGSAQPRNYAANPILCESNGTLEARLVALIRQRL